MSTQVDADLFEEITRDIRGWVTTDGLLERCEAGGLFKESDDAELAREFKKSIVRRLIRPRARGETLQEANEEWVNIRRQNKDGTSEQVYKQLRMFEKLDFVQAVQYRVQRVRREQGEVRRYKKLAVEKFGQSILKLFD